MRKLDSLLRAISSAVSLLALIFLLFVVAGNIVGRLVLDLSGGSINLMINGAIELSAYSLLILVFGAIVTAIPNGLVQVDIIDSCSKDAGDRARSDLAAPHGGRGRDHSSFVC